MENKILQMTIFDFLDPQKETKDEPNLLFLPGEEVYVIHKGDVEEYRVLDETWVFQKERRYRLKNVCYAAIKDSDLGVRVFRKKEDALRLADEYLAKHNVIRAEDIHFEELEAYQYTRDCDDRKMIAFCGNMGNGKLYIKDFMTFAHIVPDTKKARDDFAKEVANAEKTDFVPEVKNMYKCSDLTDWEYTEARCSYAVG